MEAGKSDINKPTKWVRATDCLRINRRLILIKLHFVLFYGSIAGVIPSVISYTQSVSSAAMVGLIFSVLPFVQLMMKPVFGGIADKFRKHKTVFLVSIIIVAISFFSVNFIPAIESTKPSNLPNWATKNQTTFRCEAPTNKMSLRWCQEPIPSNISLSKCSISCKILDTVKLENFLCENSTRNCTSYHEYDSENPDSTSQIDLTVSVSNVTNGSRLIDQGCQIADITSVDSADGKITFWHANLSRKCLTGESFTFSCSSTCLPNDSGPDFGTTRDGTTYRLVWIWIACIIAFTFMGTIITTLDAILLDILGENRSDYGKNRLFGSIGWGLFSVVAAQANDYASQGLENSDYSPGYYLFLVLIVLDFFVAIPMRVVPAEKPKKLTKDVLALFKNPEFVLFSFAAVFTGMVTSMFWTYIIIFNNDLNGSNMVIGVNYAVECFLSEIPFFLASGWIVRKLGHGYSMSLVLFISGFKSLCYSFVYNPWYICIIALLHGANYGIFYATAATYASIVAPPGASATLQGLLQGLFEGLGVGLGNLIGGIVYSNIGGHKMFRIFGITCMVIGCIHCVLSSILNRRKAVQNSSRINS